MTNRTVKSIFILIFLGLLIYAGLASLFQWPYKSSTYPWSGYHMFASYRDHYKGIIAMGIFPDGTKIDIPMDKVFPMRHDLIERGGGSSIEESITPLTVYTHRGVTFALCKFILRWGNTTHSISSKNISSVSLSRISWPLDKGKEFATATPLLLCP